MHIKILRAFDLKRFAFWKLLLDYYVLNKHLMMNGFQLPFWAVFTLLARCINHCMCAKEIILLSVQKFCLESIFDSLALFASLYGWLSFTNWRFPLIREGREVFAGMYTKMSTLLLQKHKWYVCLTIYNIKTINIKVFRNIENKTKHVEKILCWIFRIL